MDKLLRGGQILLGLLLVIFGLNGFLNFIPMPPPPASAAAFLGALYTTKYFWTLLKSTEILCGLAFLLNWRVALAAVILAPISVNIVLFHAFLAPAGIALALVVAALNVLVAYKNKDAYTALLSSHSNITTHTTSSATTVASTAADGSGAGSSTTDASSK